MYTRNIVGSVRCVSEPAKMWCLSCVTLRYVLARVSAATMQKHVEVLGVAELLCETLNYNAISGPSLAGVGQAFSIVSASNQRAHA